MSERHDIIEALAAHESALKQFLTRRLGCVHTASDILQRVAEKLLNQTEAPPAGNLRAYLFQAASNEAISHHRIETRRLRYETDYAHLTGELDERDAERAAVAGDSLRALNAALAELPLLTQRIFFMYRIDGRRQADIAQELGLNLSTVEKRLAAAMRHCRQRLAELEIYGTAGPTPRRTRGS